MYDYKYLSFLFLDLNTAHSSKREVERFKLNMISTRFTLNLQA